MKISELHKELEAGRLLSGDAAFVTLVAIEQLARLQGVPVSALGYAAPLFARAYPIDQTSFPGFHGGVSGFKAWRSIILNAQMRAAPGDTDDDPWRSLMRAHRLGSAPPTYNTFAEMRWHCPAGTLPCNITTDLLLTVAKTVAEEKMLLFRANINAFIGLFKIDLVRQTGLLPAVPPKRLTGTRDHFDLAPMSADIQRLRTNACRADAAYAFDYVNRLAVAAGLLNGATDTLEDLREALIGLPLPADVGVPPIAPQTLRAYIGIIIGVLGGRDPRLSQTEQAWADLRNEARAAGCDTSFLWTLWQSAIPKDLQPKQITPDIALAIVGSYCNTSMPTQCRRGCEQFDALRGVLPPDMLPPLALGISRAPKKHRQPPLPRPPLSVSHQAWNQLYEILKRGSLIDDEFQALSFVKMRAIEDGLLPSEITDTWVEHLRDTCAPHNLSRLYKAVKQISDLSHLGLPKLKPFMKRRDRHGGVPEALQDELTAMLDAMGLSASSRRQMTLATGILIERVGGCNQPNLSAFLDIDVSTFNWGTPEAQRETHVAKILSLRGFRDLPWTDAWRQLQQAVVASGMTALLNPVPKILSWRPEMEPFELHADWARKIDAKLRSTKLNPPHGRADLARTLSRHLAGIDALHEIKSVVSTGLLPPVIGDYRKITLCG